MTEKHRELVTQAPMGAGMEPVALLYTDVLNDKQICRDDMWSVTTKFLKNSAEQLAKLQQERDFLKGRMTGLRELMGYVQNGSDTTVTLWQDDATGEFVVTAGNIRGYGRSFEAALDEAIGKIKEG